MLAFALVAPACSRLCIGSGATAAVSSPRLPVLLLLLQHAVDGRGGSTVMFSPRRLLLYLCWVTLLCHLCCPFPSDAVFGMLALTSLALDACQPSVCPWFPPPLSFRQETHISFMQGFVVYSPPYDFTLRPHYMGRHCFNYKRNISKKIAGAGIFISILPLHFRTILLTHKKGL